MTEELEVEAFAPDKVFINGSTITEQDVLNEIDNTLIQLNMTHNLINVDAAIDTLLGLQRISGKSLAKLLCGTSEWWENSKMDTNFDDYMESRHGLKKVTIDRYIVVWEKIQSGEIPDGVAVRPMRDLVPIAKCLAQGYEISDKNMERLIKATSNSEISDIIRSVKGKSPRKSSLQIELARDWSLYTWKNNKRTFIGWLDKEAYDTNADAQAGIERILGVGVKIK